MAQNDDDNNDDSGEGDDDEVLGIFCVPPFVRCFILLTLYPQQLCKIRAIFILFLSKKNIQVQRVARWIMSQNLILAY